MKKKFRNFLASILSLIFILGIFPINMFKPMIVQAADALTGTYMKYETNYSQLGLDSSNGGYRVWGYVNNIWQQTTYKNEGFRINLKDEASKVNYSVGQIANGVEKMIDNNNIGVTLNLSLVNDERYVKVQYVIRNNTASPQTISLGSGADIKIGSNDYAPITKFDDGSGFSMTGDGAQFNFIGKGAYGVTDVDTFWYGNYYDVNANMFTQTSASNYSGDSGMAYAWNNRTIQGNSSQSFSVLIGIGSANKAPIVSITDPVGSFPTGAAGETYNFSGSVSDTENTTGTELYYAIDNTATVKAYTFSGVPGAFSSSIMLPSDISAGTHTVSFYAQDVDGAVSSAVTKTITVPDTKAPTFSVSGNPTLWTSSDVTLAIAASDSESGLNTAGAYSFDNGLTWTTSNTKSFSTNETVNIKVKDNSDNISSQNIVIDKIDKNAPIISSISQPPTTWTSSDVTLAISASDAESGLNTGGAYSFDDGLTWTTSNTKSFSSNATVKIKVKDNSGNISSQTIVINKIDKTFPIISVSGNPTDWTKDSVTLTVNANDAVSGLPVEAFSFDGGTTWQAANTKTYDVNTNGIVVQVKDNSGNISSQNIDITKIDKTAPNTAVIANKDNYVNNNWFNANQTITASFTNTEGCNEKLQYNVNNGIWTDGASVDVNTEGKYTVSFRVIDSLGRTSAEQTVKVNIDKTAPANAKIIIRNNEFTSFLNTITFGLFFKDTVAVTITADTAISGISKIEYQKVLNSLDYAINGTWTEGSSFNVNPDEQFIVYARITDNAGNYEIINSDGVIVDATNPALALTPDTNSWSKVNVNVNVNASDNLAGVKVVSYTTDEAVPQTGTVTITDGEGNITLTNEGQYILTVTADDNSGNTITASQGVKIDKSLPVITGVTGNPTDWTKDSVTLTVNANDAVSGLATESFSFDGGTTWQAANTKTYDVNTNGIVVQVKDNSGNISSQNIDITKIDKTAPNIAVIANKDNYVDSNWFNTNQTITASFTNTEGCNEKLQYNVNNGTWTDGASVYVNTEGKYTVSFRVIDSLGRISAEQTVKVNIDKTVPANAKITIKDKEFTSFLNTITFGLFFKDKVAVTITADSSISGISKIEYQKVLKASDYNPNGTWVEGNSFDVNPDEEFIVYARVTDNAGNYVIINSDGVIVDATNPALALTPDTSEWSKANVNVNVNASDNPAGVKVVSYTTDEAVPQTGAVAITGGQGNITLTNEGQYILTVTAEDNSGNTITASQVVKIDKSLPVITGVTGNPTDWTKDSVTLTVNANDGLSGLAAEAFSFDGGTTWQAANIKTYDVNTNGIVVQVKDNLGNIATNETINITKIDKTVPNTAVIATKDNYVDSKWFNANQTITASFTNTEGCDEKLQYNVDNGIWTDGASVDVNTEGKYTVSFRVIDSLGRASEVQTVKVNIDKTAPANAKITVKDKEFTSFLNTVTFGLFFKDTVAVTITADTGISGIDKIEYQKVSNASEYDPKATWTEKSSLSVNPDETFIIYSRITDNAGNFVIINSDGVIVDATNPALALTPDTNSWSKDNVNVKVKVSDNLAGVKEVKFTTDEAVPQTGTVAIINGEGNITLTNEGQYKLTVTANDNSLNEISESTNIKIDKTAPIITGADNSPSYFIGRVIKLTDNFGEIGGATYKNGTDTETSFKDGDLFENAGNYALTLMDKAGNSNTLSFGIKALPKVPDVIYTSDCKALIDTIRSEFNSHNDLPELYKADVDNQIKVLENRYSQLDKEVIEIKTETTAIKDQVEKLPNEVDGLMNLQKEIQDEYNKIAGNTSTLTEEEKKALENEAEYLKQQLTTIATLQNQVNDIKTQVSSINTKEDGLISQEGKISEILSNIGKLTCEQQSILKPQIDLLNSLLNKINTLKEQVKTVKEMINSIPSLDKITKQDFVNINKINKLYSEFTNEQKQLLGEDLIKQLNDAIEVLKKLMLYDANTDLTVTGIDGTSFTLDVYLVVTPINVDTNETIFSSASKNVENASKYISALEGKELLALYDVSLFRDNIKIQPDGMVKVKIKIPEELRNRTGFDIVHIADNGTVTSMNAVVEGEYLVFTTTHFSDYAIVANSITKEIPKTGSVVDFDSLIIVGFLISLIGIVLIRKRIR